MSILVFPLASKLFCTPKYATFNGMQGLLCNTLPCTRQTRYNATVWRRNGGVKFGYGGKMQWLICFNVQDFHLKVIYRIFVWLEYNFHSRFHNMHRLRILIDYQ